jgi:hypothetical protein
LLVFIVDQLDRSVVDRLAKDVKFARKEYSNLSEKYQNVLDRKLRSNPKRKKSTPFRQWIYSFAPTYKAMKRRVK